MTDSHPAGSSADQSTSHADLVEASPTVPPASAPPAPSSGRRAGVWLAVAVALAVLALALSGYLLWLQRQQQQQLQASAQQWQSAQQRSQALEQQLASVRDGLSGRLDATQQQRAKLALTFEQQVAELRAEMRAMASQDFSRWQIAEASYLVKLAGRRLWVSHDVSTAKVLLRQADSLLVARTDQASLAARAALAKDIATLAAIKVPDREQIILQLSALLEQADQLPLEQNRHVVTAPASAPASAAGSENWQTRLVESWHSFKDGFIRIREQEGIAKPMLPPEQQWFLRENLKLQLMQAQLAVYQEQARSYQQALATAQSWLQAYFAPDSGPYAGMQSALAALASESIQPNYPAKLTATEAMQTLEQSLGQESAL